MILPFRFVNFDICINEFLAISNTSFQLHRDTTATMSRCIGTCLRTYPPIGGIALGRAKYPEYKRSLCDGCISLLKRRSGLDATSTLRTAITCELILGVSALFTCSFPSLLRTRHFADTLFNTNTLLASHPTFPLVYIKQGRTTLLLISPRKKLPTETLWHSTLIQIFLSRFLLFLLCRCSLVFRIQ